TSESENSDAARPVASGRRPLRSALHFANLGTWTPGRARVQGASGPSFVSNLACNLIFEIHALFHHIVQLFTYKMINQVWNGVQWQYEAF
ncbi:hypothetical protein, partial [Escherichia coli]|uniref:hypothetical protein n=1 Tax=Escherichia coli TaxID=562 RepID=UPI0032DBB7FF